MRWNVAALTVLAFLTLAGCSDFVGPKVSVASHWTNSTLRPVVTVVHRLRGPDHSNATGPACPFVDYGTRRVFTCSFPEFDFSAHNDSSRDAYLDAPVRIQFTVDSGGGDVEAYFVGGGRAISYAILGLQFDVRSVDSSGVMRSMGSADPRPFVLLGCDTRFPPNPTQISARFSVDRNLLMRATSDIELALTTAMETC